MKVIIFGFTGILGSEVTKSINKKYELHLFNSKNINLLKKNDLLKISKLFKNAIIIYTAGYKRTLGDDFINYKKNINCFLNILEITEYYSPQKIIFFSSIEVFGAIEKKTKIDHNTPIKPFNSYAHSKVLQEEALKFFSQKNNFDFLILRFPGVYTDKFSTNSIVNKIAASVAKSKKFTLFTSGKEKRDYFYFKDIRKIIKQIFKYNIKNEIINIGSGESLTINTIIQLVQKNYNKKLYIDKSIKNENNKEYDVIFNNKYLKKIMPDLRLIKLSEFNYRKIK